MSDGSAVPAGAGAPGPGPRAPGRPLVAGVDCSTQATKVLVVEAESGEVVATGREGHVVTGEGGARESDPLGWWDALRGALAMVGRSCAGRSVPSVAGQQHGLVTLDGGGRPVRPAVLWNDTRSALDAAQLVEALGAPEWAARTGSRPAASFTVTKWAWLRRTEPDSVRATAAVRLPHDHLTERLCGAAVTDRGDASGTGWWSPAMESYDGGVGAAGCRPRPRPPSRGVRPVRAGRDADRHGRLGPRARRGDRGRPGTGDNMASALGLGLPPGQPAISLGTSGTVFMVSGQRSADPSGVVDGFADATGRFLPLTCTLRCTAAVDRVAGWLHLDRDDVAPADDVVVLPYLDGERTPNLPEARGPVTGLDSATTPGQILMAAYEGAVASLIEALDALPRDETRLARIRTTLASLTAEPPG